MGPIVAPSPVLFLRPYAVAVRWSCESMRSQCYRDRDIYTGVHFVHPLALEWLAPGEGFPPTTNRLWGRLALWRIRDPPSPVLNVATPHVLSLCTGIGGLDLAVRDVLSARTVCYVERELACCSILAARMAEGSLDAAPIYTDLLSFRGAPWRGVVDIVTAGYPCQPYSEAGRQRGSEDERDLWPEVRRVLGEVGARVAFLENVSGHLRLGFDRVLGDLAALGFNAEWELVRASEVGAPHRRDRLFVLAYTDDAGLEGWRRSGGDDPIERHAWPGGPEDDWSGVDEADWPAVERQVCGEVDGLPGRVDRLRALGNAVVPQQAAFALDLILSRICRVC